MTATQVRGTAFRAGLDDEQWFLDAAADGRPTLATTAWWELPAGTDPARLEAAVRAIVARHEVLDSRVRVDDGGVWFAPDGSGPEIVRSTARSGRLDEPIDPFRDPLVRAAVLPGPAGVGFGLQVSHAVLDDWTWDLVLAGIDDAYRGPDGDRPADVSAPQLRDWVAWQRAAGDDDVVRSGWRALLDAAGAPPPARPGTTRRGRVEWRGGPDAWRSLCRGAARFRTTPAGLVAAVFGAALTETSGRPRALRVPYLNRDVPEAFDVVGNLGCQMLLPVPHAPGAPLAAAVESVRRRTAEAAGLAPVSLHSALRGPGAGTDLAAGVDEADLHCWAPFVTVHPPLSDDDEDGLLAGTAAVSVHSPPDVELDGCEVAIDARADGLEVVVTWRGLPDPDVAAVRDAAAALVAELGRLPLHDDPNHTTHPRES